MSAPPSRNVIMRFAVSVVTCRQAEMRMPFSGWFLMKSLRMICRTGMDWLAHSIRRFPRSARSMFLISDGVCVTADVDMFSCLRALVGMKFCKVCESDNAFDAEAVEQALRPAGCMIL